MDNPGKSKNNETIGSDIPVGRSAPVEQPARPAADAAHLPAEGAACPTPTQTGTRKTSRVNRLLIKGCLALTGLGWTSVLIVVLVVLGAFNPRPPKITLVNDSDPPACTEIGTGWISPVDGMTLVCVPAGEFIMGSAEEGYFAYAEYFYMDDEIPEHVVYQDAYWIDRTEVTNAQYARCVAAGACRAHPARTTTTRQDYYGNSQYDNYPVIYVTWKDAGNYCQWAGRQLPTEAQWEKAARGTEAYIYPWGNSVPYFRRCNCNGNMGDTTEVGRYPAGASPYGALDMAGNVFEWVVDWYEFSYYSNQTSWSNPTGPDTGDARVVRGGSWGWPSIRTAYRSARYPGNIYPNTGFRCALPVEP